MPKKPAPPHSFPGWKGPHKGPHIIEYDSNPESRRRKRSERRRTLFTKSYELATICGGKIFIIWTDDLGQNWIYSSDDKVFESYTSTGLSPGKDEIRCDEANNQTPVPYVDTTVTAPTPTKRSRHKLRFAAQAARHSNIRINATAPTSVPTTPTTLTSPALDPSSWARLPTSTPAVIRVTEVRRLQMNGTFNDMMNQDCSQDDLAYPNSPRQYEALADTAPQQVISETSVHQMYSPTDSSYQHHCSIVQPLCAVSEQSNQLYPQQQQPTGGQHSRQPVPLQPQQQYVDREQSNPIQSSSEAQLQMNSQRLPLQNYNTQHNAQIQSTFGPQQNMPMGGSAPQQSTSLPFNSGPQQNSPVPDSMPQQSASLQLNSGLQQNSPVPDSMPQQSASLQLNSGLQQNSPVPDSMPQQSASLQLNSGLQQNSPVPDSMPQQSASLQLNSGLQQNSPGPGSMPQQNASLQLGTLQQQNSPVRGFINHLKSPRQSQTGLHQNSLMQECPSSQHNCTTEQSSWVLQYSVSQDSIEMQQNPVSEQSLNIQQNSVLQEDDLIIQQQGLLHMNPTLPEQSQTQLQVLSQIPPPAQPYPSEIEHSLQYQASVDDIETVVQQDHQTTEPDAPKVGKTVMRFYGKENQKPEKKKKPVLKPTLPKTRTCRNVRKNERYDKIIADLQSRRKKKT